MSGHDQWATARPALLMVGAALAVGVACTQPSDAELAEAGQDVFQSNCARCHQPDGQGFEPVAPALAGNRIVQLHDPDPTIRIVLEGGGSMPAFRDRLDADELAQVVTFIRGAWDNDAPAVTPSQMK